MDRPGDGECQLLGIESARTENEVLIGLTGELDVSTAPALHDLLHQCIESGVSRIVCDLAGLRYIDSTGLSVVLMAHKRLDQIGGCLTLVSPASNVRRLFEVTGVDVYLDIQPA